MSKHDFTDNALVYLKRMQLFYNIFPYPGRPIWVFPSFLKHLHAHGGYWLLYPDVTHIYPDKSSWQKLEALCPSSFRILLAGCGTDEPLLFALLHRQAYIDAVDLSEQSLKFAKRRIRLARFLGLLQGQNITFHVADVCEHVQTASQKYHYIQCFGVLHHQPCPQKFFFTLAEALETGGIFRLMFYPQSSRKLERGLQKRFASVWECMPSKNFKNLLTLYWHALLLWSWLCMQRLFCMRWSRRFRYLHLRPTCVSDALLHPSDFSVALTDILIWAQAAHLQLKFIASRSVCGYLQGLEALPQILEAEQKQELIGNLFLVFQKI